MTRLELKVPPVVVWVACAAAAIAAGCFVPAANLAFPGHRAVAVAIVVAGIAVAFAGALAFRRAGTTVDPRTPDKARTVVASGIYRRTRNPMYLGLAGVLLGFAAWWASVPALLAVAAFVAYITRFQIRPEERALQARFGDEYARYRERVRRWL